MKVKPIKIFNGSVFVKQNKRYFPAIYQGVKNPEILYLRRADNIKFQKCSHESICNITGISKEDLLNIIKMEKKKNG